VQLQLHHVVVGARPAPNLISPFEGRTDRLLKVPEYNYFALGWGVTFCFGAGEITVWDVSWL